MPTKIIISDINYPSDDPEATLSVLDPHELSAPERLNLISQLLPIHSPDKLTKDTLARYGLYYLADIKEQKGIEFTNLDNVYVQESYGRMTPVDEKVIPLLAKRDSISFWLPVSIEHAAVGKAIAKARKDWEAKNGERLEAKRLKQIEKARKTLAALGSKE